MKKLEVKRFSELGVEVERDSEGEPVRLIIGERQPIERELRVVRIGPNPRMVLCEYWELAERKVVVINVKDNRKWLKGMVFKMREPVSEEEYRGVWRYLGKAPRRKGRWSGAWSQRQKE